MILIKLSQKKSNLVQNLFLAHSLVTYDIMHPKWHSISEDAKDLIKKILTTQESRLTAIEVLQHP